MFDKIEIRRHSYSNKTAILHIDRIETFKRKLLEKQQAVKVVEKKGKISNYEKF